MATQASSSGKRRAEQDKKMARRMKDLGIERETGVCALCYRIIRIDSIYGRYTHRCPGGRIQ